MSRCRGSRAGGAAAATVLLNVFAHGLSAMPGIGLYARAIGALSPDAPEKWETDEPRQRP